MISAGMTYRYSPSMAMNQSEETKRLSIFVFVRFASLGRFGRSSRTCIFLTTSSISHFIVGQQPLYMSDESSMFVVIGDRKREQKGSAFVQAGTDTNSKVQAQSPNRRVGEV